jgi:DHA1 family multidrug resistance protein-like MFS transporter
MKSWKASYVALLIAQTLAIMGFGLSTPIIPLFLEEDIGMTDPVMLKAWSGLLHSSAAVTLAIFAPIWGDTFSRKAMLLRAMFAGAVMISLLSLVNAPWQLLVLRTIQGCLTGTVTAATVLTVGISPAAQVAFTLGILQTGIAIGHSLGPLIGGVLSDFFGYRIAFLCTGITLATAGILVLKLVDDTSRTPGPKHIKNIKLIPDFKPITSSPLLITIILVSFGVHVANNTVSPMLALFIRELVQNQVVYPGSDDPLFIGSSTGIVFGAGAAATAIAAVLIGKFALRIGYWKTLIFCLSASALLTIPQAFVSSVPQLAILRAITAFFKGGTSPVISAIIASSSEKKSQGVIYGLNSSVGAAGNALGPMIGSVSAMFGYRMIFLASALTLGISACLTARRRKLTAQ